MRKIQVLIIDDSSLVHNVFQRAWSEAEIDSAYDGLEAVAKVNKKHYDVIVCDYCMPNMNGEVFLKNHRPKDSIVISNSSAEAYNKILSPYCDISWSKDKDSKSLIELFPIIKGMLK